MIPMPGLDQQLNPAFSPDGKRIAFLAVKGGDADIYTYDFETKSIVNITQDRSFDFAPTFSPDGEWIYYSGVQGTSAKIFRIRPGVEGSREQVTYGDSNDEDAAVSPDGKRLFFSSDRNGGVYNVYSVDLANGETNMFTNVVGGCFSPAILTARDGSERLVFSAYYKRRFMLYVTDAKKPYRKLAELNPAPSPAGPSHDRSVPALDRGLGRPRKDREAEPQALPRERPDPGRRRLRRPVPLQYDPDLRRQPRRPPAAGRPVDGVRLYERQPVLHGHRLTPAEGRRRLLQPQLLLRPQSRRHDRHAEQLPVHRRQRLRGLPLQSLLPAGRGSRLQRPGFQRVSGLGRDRSRAAGSSGFRRRTGTRRSARASSATRRSTSRSDRSPAGSSRSVSPGRPTSAVRSCPDRTASR